MICKSAFGSSQFGWWIRSALCLEVSDKKPILNPNATHVYGLKAVKGAGDLEWKSRDGYDTNERYIGYSTDGNIYWIDYDQDTENKTAQKQRDRDEQKEMIYAVLPICDLMAIDRKTIANKVKIPVNTVRDYLYEMDNICKVWQ